MLPAIFPAFLPAVSPMATRQVEAASIPYDGPAIEPNAVLLSTLAWFALIITIPPLVWHISQRNVAAAGLMIWILLFNIIEAINPIIWPNDNMDTWWNGAGWCDIVSHLWVGSSVAVPAALACMLRKLADVMDTRKISVVPARRQKIRENVIDVLACWGAPILAMVAYFIVQPARYVIKGITGCSSIYDKSWVSFALSWMWIPIITLIAGYYNAILLYRLYRYRREFNRIMSARDFTKSRFMRLLILSMILLFGCIPYSIYICVYPSRQIVTTFNWNRVHSANWNQIYKIPSNGTVQFDQWAHIVIAIIVFLFFGTGRDANVMYKRCGIVFGLGKCFPSLYRDEDSASRTPTNMTSSGTLKGLKFWKGSMARDRRSTSVESEGKSFATETTSTVDHALSTVDESGHKRTSANFETSNESPKSDHPLINGSNNDTPRRFPSLGSLFKKPHLPVSHAPPAPTGPLLPLYSTNPRHQPATNNPSKSPTASPDSPFSPIASAYTAGSMSGPAIHAQVWATHGHPDNDVPVLADGHASRKEKHNAGSGVVRVVVQKEVVQETDEISRAV